MKHTEKRAVSPAFQDEDYEWDGTLRPKRLAQFIGQEKIKSNLRVFIEAAKSRKEPLDHVLLKGAPGLGKTTLAHIIAYEMNAPIRVTSGPAIERPGDLAAILTNLEEGTVLFIDEIHRLSRPVEEILYPAMEDFKLDIVIGKGPGARSIRLDLTHFTLVGATTRAGLLTGPLRDRFGIVHDFEFYDINSLETIVNRSAKILGYGISPEAAKEIASRSRGTPRVANRLLKRIRDFADYGKKIQSHSGNKQTPTLSAGKEKESPPSMSKENLTKGEKEAKPYLDLETARYGLEQLEIDEYGLDRIDRQILLCIIEQFGGGPVGIESIAASVSEDSGTIEEMYEPYLLQQGFLQRTSRGRMAGEAAYQVLGKTAPKRQAELF